MSEIFWGIYKMFHDPPGSPKDQKCVGCKLAAGGASMGLSVLCLDKLRRTFVKNQFKAVGFGFAAFGFSSTAFVLLRMAYDHDQYNKNLIKSNAELIRSQRREKSQQDLLQNN